LLHQVQVLIILNNIHKNRIFFQKYKVTNSREIAQLTERLKQKVHTKAQRIRRYKVRKNQYIQNSMFIEDATQSYRYLGEKTIDIKDHSHMNVVELY
jgi:cytidylate kinase